MYIVALISHSSTYHKFAIWLILFNTLYIIFRNYGINNIIKKILLLQSGDSGHKGSIVLLFSFKTYPVIHFTLPSVKII